MIESILVVCHGNICRSPTGERLLKQLLPDKQIFSAGLQALEGYPADLHSYSSAINHGLSLDNHQAQQITTKLCHECELILAMDKKQIDQIYLFWPETRGKTLLFGQWINMVEIGDPYGKSQECFDQLFILMQRAAKSWADILSPKGRNQC